MAGPEMVAGGPNPGGCTTGGPSTPVPATFSSRPSRVIAPYSIVEGVSDIELALGVGDHALRVVENVSQGVAR